MSGSVIRDAEGREHARHFARKADAQNWLDEVTAAVVTGQYVDPKLGKKTLSTYAREWQKTQVASEATARIVDNALRLHIEPLLGRKPIASVRKSDVQGLVKALSAHLAPRSVRNVYDVFARILSAAVEDRIIAVSPCQKIALPEKGNTEVVPPTVEEVERVVELMPDRYRAAAVLLAGSGLRIGELLGLKVTDIDFLRREVRVERQRLQNGKIGDPKSKKSTRTVPIAPVIVETLAAHLSLYPSCEWLFLSDAEEPLTYQRWQKVWRPVRKAAGTNMGTHDFRHFFASALIAGGASVKQVQAALGHESAAVTLRTYTHLWPGDDDQTRAVIETTLSGLRTVCGLPDTEPNEGPAQTA